MTFFYKIVKNLAPKYLQSYLLPQALNQYSTRSAKKNLLTTLPSRTLSFSNKFFPYCIKEWNKLNDNLRNENSIYKFKTYLTKFINVKENYTFSISDPFGLKLLTHPRLNFSHLIININLGIASETLLTLCVLAVIELKQQITTTSCVAKILLLSDRVSSTEFLKLMMNSEI